MLFRRKSTQLKPDYDGSYSTLNREKIQQMKSQPLHTPTELYDQIQLSPSTGQAEFISNTECENINNTLTPSPHVIHPCVNKEQPAYPNSGVPQTTSSNLSPHKKESTSEQPTYAVVDKKRKQRNETRGKKSAQIENTAAEKKGDRDPLYSLNITDQITFEQRDQPEQRHNIHEEVYAVVNKKSKEGKADANQIATPIPSYTCLLYTSPSPRDATLSRMPSSA